MAAILTGDMCVCVCVRVCVYHVHIHNALFIQPQEKGNLAICDNMDRP